MTQKSIEISTLKDEIKPLSTLITAVAVQNNRLDMLEKRLDELRHGEGFVYPIGSHLATPARK